MNHAIAGLSVGILVGICFYKAGMLKYDEQVSSMIFKKMTPLKFYMSAQLAALISLTILRLMGIVEVSFNVFNWINAILGGLVFGVGWGILGYCPGTCSGAIGTGKIDGIFGALGIIVGSLVFAVIFPFVSAITKNFISIELGLSSPLWLITISLLITISYLLIFRAFERRRL